MIKLLIVTFVFLRLTTIIDKILQNMVDLFPGILYNRIKSLQGEELNNQVNMGLSVKNLSYSNNYIYRGKFMER